MHQTREAFLKGWLSALDFFAQVYLSLFIGNIIYLCYIIRCLYEEVNSTEPFPLMSIPWLDPDSAVG